MREQERNRARRRDVRRRPFLDRARVCRPIDPIGLMKPIGGLVDRRFDQRGFSGFWLWGMMSPNARCKCLGVSGWWLCVICLYVVHGARCGRVSCGLPRITGSRQLTRYCKCRLTCYLLCIFEDVKTHTAFEQHPVPPVESRDHETPTLCVITLRVKSWTLDF